MKYSSVDTATHLLKLVGRTLVGRTLCEVSATRPRASRRTWSEGFHTLPAHSRAPSRPLHQFRPEMAIGRGLHTHCRHDRHDTGSP